MNSDVGSHSFDKVTVFVLRYRARHTEVLTFLHPLAGRQLPAGSVEQGELPVEAARREVIEETGFEGLTDFVAIGEWVEALEGEAVALADTAVRDASGIVTDRIKRGHRVRIERSDGARVLVRRLVYDFNVQPPAELPVDAGWADLCGFATRIRRSFFVARAENDGRLSWVQHADGHDFVVEWRPLNRHLTLIAGQSEWLAAHFDALEGYQDGIAS
ncbi:MAG: NUDIX domain-containing protein [Paracoccus sp. (in: a-proteobacteria)]|nr:NUDIX domain-containing protein [Paracoccus sp. (in: a-proteobacteria)]